MNLLLRQSGGRDPFSMVKHFLQPFSPLFSQSPVNKHLGLFDLSSYFHLTITGNPFLQGRAFVTASSYARILPPQLMSQYLSASLDALESSASGVPLKVAALKAIRKYVLLDYSVSTSYGCLY